jgi:drug/metabolite transporter (DMT)-like permease
VLASIFLKERFGTRAWMGTAVSLGGVLLIAAAQPGGLGFGSGASLVALAAICAGSYFVLQRPLVAKYGALTSASFTILAGALLLSPWLASGLQQTFASPPAGWGAVLFLALGPGVLGYLAWMRALDCFGAARATNFLYLIAPWATLLDWGITGERPALLTWVGGAAALIGMVLVHRDRAAHIRLPPARASLPGLSLEMERTR